jgi:exodeoxyribonuclease-5
MRKDAYTFTTFRRKGKWETAAANAGQSKASGAQAFAAAKERFSACAEAYDAFFSQVSAALLHRFRPEFDGLLDLYARHKRDAALLDFDDLILKARDLLQAHEAVRQDLQARFRHILVDEFQDTDPVQCEILWWLAGDDPDPSGRAQDGAQDSAWDRRRLNQGQLFLVGDPKQSVYRFRGADVASYLRAKQAVEADDPNNVLEITTNFRSAPGILQWVNARFEAPIAEQSLTYAPLTSTATPDNAPRVATIDVPVAPNDQGKIKADEMRDAEAREVARLCQQLIGDLEIPDGDGGTRPCRAGDIALLAPSGTSLYVYERFLEERGVPIATQAGKGFFRRQEVQDLIAIARTLADPRDTLALGALLRGPLVGMSEEQLLDIAGTLPRGDRAQIPRLTLLTDPGDLPDGICRTTLEALQSLHKRARRTSPFELLADAVELLRVRPLLEQRHRGDAERALANVDLFLEMARPYAVRGLRAFATDMRRKWDEGDRQAEGRPDAEAEAVQVITMHAAKGLEWPVVIPVNTMTGFRAPSKPLLRRSDDTVHVNLGAVPPQAREALAEDEKEQTRRERQRLWYVATTRPRELMILPRLDPAPKNCWQTLVDLDIPNLPLLDTAGYREAAPGRPDPGFNEQTREDFAAEATRIQGLHRKLTWRQPSRHDPAEGRAETPRDEAPVPEDHPARVAAYDDALTAPTVIGGLPRGLVLHKLIEEILTGELDETEAAMTGRADALLRQLGQAPASDPSEGYAPEEIATAARAALVQVADLRDRLVPEVTLSASEVDDDGVEVITAGTGDAVVPAKDAAEGIEVVVDWKSDPDPSASSREAYRDQVRGYVDTAGAKRGLVVYATRGEFETVTPTLGAPASGG